MLQQVAAEDQAADLQVADFCLGQARLGLGGGEACGVWARAGLGTSASTAKAAPAKAKAVRVMNDRRLKGWVCSVINISLVMVYGGFGYSNCKRHHGACPRGAMLTTTSGL